jgi:hemolysin III
MSGRQQTLPEEIANAITHGLGVLFCLVAIPFMIIYAIQSNSAVTLWAVSIFCFGMLMVYLSSTLYHAVQHKNAKRLLQIWDHISIFILIAGSYTPLVIKFTNSSTAFVFLGIMWSIVAVGSLLKLFYTGKYKVASVILYLVLGWMALFIIKPIMTNVPPHIFWLIAISGIAYTLGVIFYLWTGLRYAHAVWHVFVLSGTIMHFFAVYNSIPLQPHIQ